MTTNQNPKLGSLRKITIFIDGNIIPVVDHRFSSAGATTILQVFTEFSHANEGVRIHWDITMTVIELSNAKQAVDMFNYLVEIHGREDKYVKEFINAVTGIAEFTAEEEEVDEVIEFTDTVDIFLKDGEVVDAGFYMFLEAFSVEHSIESNELLGGGTRVRLRGFYDLPEAYERFTKQGRKVVVPKPTPAVSHLLDADVSEAFQFGHRIDDDSYMEYSPEFMKEMLAVTNPGTWWVNGDPDWFVGGDLPDELKVILESTWGYFMKLVVADLEKYGYCISDGIVHYVHKSEPAMDEGTERVKLSALIAASEMGNLAAAGEFFEKAVDFEISSMQEWVEATDL